ncbi:superinfection immunity protein [Bradyrhizobium yuanmingense]|uniref:superinfection immunity protein n=1 Tax=Bradyrhizobium yuanmingense TaxID=108015 RepID=UPI0023B93BCC|nr:superinfection immunity protein [Bradyrhizobium yuanmingense]MDF0496179.1 superinfection immunity protein [Bradyrhizobium yuanmingense]
MDELMARLDRVELLEAEQAKRVREYDAQIEADPAAREVRSVQRSIKFVLLIVALAAIVVFCSRLWLTSWVGFWIGLYLVLLPLYFAPSGVAFGRQHPQRWAILALNITAGWTLVGWVGALVWSLIVSERRKTIVVREVEPGRFVEIKLSEASQKPPPLQSST